MTLMRIAHDPVMRMLMHNFVNQEQETERRCRWMPATNVTEDDKAFHLEIAAPGFSKKDFKINLEKNTLTISSERKNEKEKEEMNYNRREFGSGDFCRAFTLPENIDTENIKAEYKNGILSIELPKMEEVKVKKEIQIA